MQLVMQHGSARSWTGPTSGALALLAAAALGMAASSGPAQAQTTPIQIAISPVVPFDVSDPSNLQQAAVFAWQEFIALTWPAMAQGPTSFPRGQAQTGGPASTYGAPGPTGQVVWETLRHKVEVFPGMGEPNGFVNDAAKDYGYDAKPEYIYGSGPIPPAHDNSVPTIPPFNNLDEVTQISLNAMYAGVVDPQKFGMNSHTDQEEKILFEAKANRAVYTYSAANKFYASDDPAVSKFKQNTIDFLKSGDAAAHPPPYVDLPASDPAAGQLGAIETKAAWRRLTAAEIASKRYYSAHVRYYVEDEQSGQKQFVDSNQAGETWGLVALHIIHKTKNAPSFIYATFGQIDNILDGDGNPVEEPDGTTKPQYLSVEPFSPALTIKESMPTSPFYQWVIQGNGAVNTNSPKLYYHNALGRPVIFKQGVTTQPTCDNFLDANNYYLGPVNVNRRLFPLPATITTVNAAAQSAIRAANQDAVWQYYKLVNVQARPLDLMRDASIIATEMPTYYLANIVVETNAALQRFRGGLIDFSGFACSGSISDFSINMSMLGQKIDNMYVVGPNNAVVGYNMGGCMGCHGSQGQKSGGDFSVLLARGRVVFPESIGEDEENVEAMRALSKKYLRDTMQ